MITLHDENASGFFSRDEWEEMVSRYSALIPHTIHGEDRYKDSLGWLDVDEWAGEDALCAVEEAAAQIREDADVFVLIGVGGSNNAARSVIKALAPKSIPQIVYMGNSLSPQALSEAMKGLRGKSVYVCCIAKNFETLEPGLSFRLLRAFLAEQYGEGANRRITAIGTPGSHFERLCDENGWRFLVFPPNIGGRFTALSSVGLLPMAAAGIDIRALAEGAKGMQKSLRAPPAKENPALRYACLRNLLYHKGYHMEMLSAFEPQLRWFFKWWIQLFAESEGKDGKGLFPVASEYSEELHSVGQFVQDGSPLLFETFLRVKTPNASLVIPSSEEEDGFDYLTGKELWDVNKAAQTATFAAHSQKLPCVSLCLGTLDAAGFGALFYFFQYACYLSGSILGVNPFDQPGVEAYKRLMFEALGK